MLDYEPAKPRYHFTPQDQVWLSYRLGYYGLHLLFFIVIGFWIGPNVRLFHSPFSPSPAYYVPDTRDYITMIAAIKAYQRDFGKLPFGSSDLPPQYAPANFNGEDGEILNTTSITFPDGNRGVLEYEFSPAKEGWYIHSPRYDGRLPAAIVPAAPKPTKATINPTSSTSNAN